MGVAFDEAGGDVATVRVEHAFALRFEAFGDLGDDAVANADIRAERRGAGAVDDGPVLDQHIVH